MFRYKDKTAFFKGEHTFNITKSRLNSSGTFTDTYLKEYDFPYM